MMGGFTEVFEKARHCGLELTVAQETSALAAGDLRLVERLITWPMDDPILIDLAEVLHRTYPFESVLSFQEFGLMNAARIQDRLGLFGNPPRPVALTRDKLRMRQHLRAVGIPTTPHVATNSARELREFAETAGWPIVLKPRYGTGSRQVHRVDSATDLDPALAAMFAVDPHTQILAEKYLFGPEVSVEAITWEGRHEVLIVTDKLTTGAPHFVELGHTMPACLPSADLAAVRDLTVSFLDSIGHRYGPSHTEIIRTGTGPVIVESHTRTGGDRIFEMVELISKVDMILATLRGFAGRFEWPRQINEIVASNGGVAIRYLDLGAGVIRRVRGMAEAAQLPGVIRVDGQLSPGTQLRPIRMSRDRPGYVLATGNSPAQAAENALAAVHQIAVELE